MVKLSIIIPFYNTYDLTCELMNELRKQINNEVEVVIIDDSNDKRLDKYNDIAKIFHYNKRQGSSKARNIGIDSTKGKYIAFIDSDDMISNDYIQTLLKAIDEIDANIIVFDWMDKNTKEVCYHPENYAVWKAIYKREITPKFEEDFWYNEDVPFQQELDKLKCSKEFINNVLYYYNSNRIGSNMWQRDMIRRNAMIKCEVIETFTFARFDELEHLERKSIDVPGKLLVGDTFECTKEIADYLLGDNALKKAVVKVIEVEPIKVVETDEAKDIAINFYTGEEVKPKKKKKK